MSVSLSSISRAGLVALGLFCTTLFVPAIAEAQQPFEMNVQPPELTGGPWLNTPGNESMKLASRKGKVTIVEFWTFG